MRPSPIRGEGQDLLVGGAGGGYRHFVIGHQDVNWIVGLFFDQLLVLGEDLSALP